MRIGESKVVKVSASTGGYGAITITRNSLNSDPQLKDDGDVYKRQVCGCRCDSRQKTWQERI